MFAVGQGGEKGSKEQPHHINKDPPDKEGDRQMRLKLFEDAIKDQHLGEATKPCLLNARRRAPALFSEESDPSWFLDFAQQDVNGAIDRLEMYWAKRQEVFEDRAYLPLMMKNPRDQQAAGKEEEEDEEDEDGVTALMPSEFDVLRSAEQWAMLPPDEVGAPVFFVNCADPFIGDPAVRLRCLFYLLSMAVENDKSRNEGVVLLIALPGDGDPDNVSVSIESFLGLLLGAMPMKLKSLHFVAISEETETEELLRTYLDETLGSAVKGKSNVHVGSKRAEVIRKLETAGLVMKSLPTAVGGTWSGENKLSGRKRKAQEVNMKAYPRGGQSDKSDGSEQRAHSISDSVGSGRDVGEKGAAKVVVSASPKKDDDEAEQRKTFLRQRNALYARRKYARRKIETEVLQDQCLRLEEQNHYLRLEEKRLEALLNNSNQIVSLYEGYEGMNQHDSSRAPSLPSSAAGVTDAAGALLLQAAGGSSQLIPPQQQDPSFLNALVALSQQQRQQPVGASTTTEVQKTKTPQPQQQQQQQLSGQTIKQVLQEALLRGRQQQTGHNTAASCPPASATQQSFNNGQATQQGLLAVNQQLTRAMASAALAAASSIPQNAGQDQQQQLAQLLMPTQAQKSESEQQQLQQELSGQNLEQVLQNALIDNLLRSQQQQTGNNTSTSLPASATQQPFGNTQASLQGLSVNQQLTQALRSNSLATAPSLPQNTEQNQQQQQLSQLLLLLLGQQQQPPQQNQQANIADGNLRALASLAQSQESLATSASTDPSSQQLLPQQQNLSAQPETVDAVQELLLQQLQQLNDAEASN